MGTSSGGERNVVHSDVELQCCTPETRDVINQSWMDGWMDGHFECMYQLHPNQSASE